jgi:quinol monooxygenase YgiN
MSFARKVRFTVKNGQAAEFNRLMVAEVLPLMKQAKGFHQNLTVLANDKGTSLSVWADRASAETYNTNTYPEILKKLGTVLEGTPRVDTYETILTAVAEPVSA